MGPQLAAPHPAMTIAINAMTHLKPVGLYPPISTDLSQICLYPVDAQAAGFIGHFPGIRDFILFLPAVTTPQNLVHMGSASSVTGIVRFVTPEMFKTVGIGVEKWEEYRQLGLLWYLDLFSEQTTITPLDDATVPEFWGGLYASGHLEFEGKLKLGPLIQGMAECIRGNGAEVHAIQNKVNRKEWLVSSRGIRATIDSQAPLYCIHMDAELAIDYSKNRQRFDLVCESFMAVVQEAAKLSSVEISNKNDLDFSYTQSSEAFKVLSSASAEAIDDPVGLAMRDWHRQRSTVSEDTDTPVQLTSNFS